MWILRRLALCFSTRILGKTEGHCPTEVELSIGGRNILKKSMLIAEMLALVLVVAAPAIAQVTNAVGQESETGDVTITGTATQSGSNSNQCVTPLQFGNTGSL